MRSPHVLQLIMDSLRYWVLEMHVDGFRFDLAATLARQFHEVDKLSAFFDIIQQDPVISQVKLIAEPWDLGDGGYQVGNFPPLWTEWNGKYRDTVRDFWRGRAGLARPSSPPGSPAPATSTPTPTAARPPRSTSSSPTTASPCATWCPTTRSTTTPTARAATTARATTGPGTAASRARPTTRRSTRCGCGSSATSSPPCWSARACRCSPTVTSWAGRSAATTTSTPRTTSSPGSTGTSTPTSRTCSPSPPAAIALRKAHPVLRRRRFFAGDAKHGGQSALGDIEWLKPDGTQMDDGDWNTGFARTLMVFLNGDAIPEPDQTGRRITDDHFLLLFNAHSDPINFHDAAASLRRQLADPAGHGRRHCRPDRRQALEGPVQASIHAHSVVVLSTITVPEPTSGPRRRSARARVRPRSPRRPAHRADPSQGPSTGSGPRQS